MIKKIKQFGDMQVKLHLNDLPSDVSFGDSVAIDTETMGLYPIRDRLCLVQLTFGDGVVHLIKFDGNDYSAPNLSSLLESEDIVKIFHFARFDIAVLYHYLGVQTKSVYCTKIASKLTRTYTDKHGLKNLVNELLGINLNKQQQSSDWGACELTPEQQEYASNDVIFLHELKIILDKRLDREGRWDLAKQSFKYLMTRAILDLEGFGEMDIFSHT